MESVFSFERNRCSRMYSAKKERMQEKMQQRIEAGSMTERFPEVANIIVTMMYKQRGINALLRTVNFSPESYAFFRIGCLSKDCIDGGFDLTQVITTMIRNRKETTKGNLGCEGNDLSAGHSDIAYEVVIQYVH